MTNSSWEDYLENQITTNSLTKPTREYRFIPPRRFRFDFAWVDVKFAVEVDGNVFGKSRHTSGKGFSVDCEKFALACIDGWRVMRVTTGQVSSGEAITWIKAYFDKQGYVNV